MPRVRVIKVPAEPPASHDAPASAPEVDSHTSPSVEISADVSEVSRSTVPAHPAPAHAPGKSNRSSSYIVVSKRLAIGVIAVLLILLLILAISKKSTDSPPTNTNGTNSTASSADTPQTLAEKYHKRIISIAEVPSDQTPSMIPIDDADAANLKQKNPELFRNSAKGDVVLFYTKQLNGSKSAVFVLYRPTTNKIITLIEVANNTEQKNTN